MLQIVQWRRLPLISEPGRRLRKRRDRGNKMRLGHGMRLKLGKRQRG